MHLIRESKHYQCMDCGQCFLYSKSLTYLGASLTSFGVILMLFIHVLNLEAFDPGRAGPLALTGYVLSAFITTLGIILISISM